MAIIRYTQNIDQVYKNLKDDTDQSLQRLDGHLRKDPDKFDHDFCNLKSYMEDLDAQEE